MKSQACQQYSERHTGGGQEPAISDSVRQRRQVRPPARSTASKHGTDEQNWHQRSDTADQGKVSADLPSGSEDAVQHVSRLASPGLALVGAVAHAGRELSDPAARAREAQFPGPATEVCLSIDLEAF